MDANGNTTVFQANGWSYGLGYNDANRLAVVQQNGSTVATYGLNGIGERVTKTLSGSTQSYVYDEAGKLLGEYATGQSRDYVWADGTLVAILDNPAQGGGTIHYVYTDNLGTPRAVTAPTGTVVWDWPYNKNPFGEAQASGNGYTLNLRYPGQYFDAETELDYNYFRDYEPGTGRYVQSDPNGLNSGSSTYSYVQSQPLSYVDPKGLFHLASRSSGAGAQGGVWCDYGTLRLFFDMNAYNSMCADVQECLAEHEETHIADANQENPGLCHWYSPLLDEVVLAPDSEVEGIRTELHAYNVELNCLESFLKNEKCAKGDRCQEQIREEISLIENIEIPTVLRGNYGGS